MAGILPLGWGKWMSGFWPHLRDHCHALTDSLRRREGQRSAQYEADAAYARREGRGGGGRESGYGSD